jgi:hypothetical protein
MELDYNTGLKVARMEGEEAGCLIGEKIGMLHLCQHLLPRPETPTDELARLPLEELPRLAQETRRELQEVRK